MSCNAHGITTRIVCAVCIVWTTVNGEGATHLCDVVACQLPEAGWWEQGGNNRNGRSLNRSNSSRGRSRSIQEAAVVAEVPEDLQAEREIE